MTISNDPSTLLLGKTLELILKHILMVSKLECLYQTATGIVVEMTNSK